MSLTGWLAACFAAIYAFLCVVELRQSWLDWQRWKRDVEASIRRLQELVGVAGRPLGSSRVAEPWRASSSAEWRLRQLERRLDGLERRRR